MKVMRLFIHVHSPTTPLGADGDVKANFSFIQAWKFITYATHGAEQ